MHRRRVDPKGAAATVSVHNGHVGLVHEVCEVGNGGRAPDQASADPEDECATVEAALPAVVVLLPSVARRVVVQRVDQRGRGSYGVAWRDGARLGISCGVGPRLVGLDNDQANEGDPADRGAGPDWWRAVSGSAADRGRC